ncbi:MAG: hypothetical protein WAX89_02435, partial [Alphaproteobacteria bacterium]
MLVMILLATALWGYVLITHFLLADDGLHFGRYISGALTVGAATLAGYLLIVFGVHMLDFRDSHKTGFEASTVDHTGTTFNLKLSLSKFLPDIVNPPVASGLSALESELIGFYNSLGTWPYDLSRPDYHLNTHAFAFWRIMCGLPNVTSIHRVAALAYDIGKVYAYREKRTIPPWWQWREKPTSRYSFRSHEHGGMAAFLLSQMPAFHQFPEGLDAERARTVRRALLTAIRYSRDPLKLPSNSDPLARDILDMLSRAQANMLTSGQGTTVAEVSAADIAALHAEVLSLLPNVLAQFPLNNADTTPDTPALYLGRGVLALRQEPLA